MTPVNVPRFYCPAALAPGARVDLPDAAAGHVARVLRMQPDEAVTLFDGTGGEYAGTLLRVAKNGVTVQVAEFRPVERESPLDVTLIQGLATGDKMDWIVQKATELGVTRIFPVEMRRSVLRLDGERADKRVEHWQSIAAGACEQSGRNRVPRVEPIMAMAKRFDPSPAMSCIALAPGEGAPLAALPVPGGPVAFVVGPEGGFADDEIAILRRAQCHFATLGPRVLRTETAGMAALAALQTLWGDWKA